MSERKNWIISKTNILVWRPLTQPKQIKWVSTIPMLVVECCLSPSNWLEWMKLEAINWYCNLSPMSFSMSFSNMLRRTIGQNIFGKSYNTLLGFGIIIKVDILKCNGQWPRLMHVLVMLTMLNGYLLLSTTTLRYLQETWLGPRVDKLLYFLIEFLNSLFKKFSYSDKNFKGISSNGHIFT